MKRSELDRLGERLRHEVTAADLTLLDAYRRSFRGAYDAVIDRIRSELDLEVSGRPAKSTAAIVDKLRRGTMRVTQMQDIAGCRTVALNIADQDRLIQRLAAMFDQVTVVDRRAMPSHGYRAVHVIVRSAGLPVEIQVRTGLQHVWAEQSEKFADRFGIALKYGGGPAEFRPTLDEYSVMIAKFENIGLDLGDGQAARIELFEKSIRDAVATLTIALKDES